MRRRSEGVTIIDAGIHLWSPESPSGSWPSDRRGNPPQRETAMEPAEMLELMDAAAVERALVVPPIWVGDDNHDALRWTAEFPDRFAVLGRFDLWSDDRGVLERWLKQPGMLGIRMSYPGHRGPGWLNVDANAWFWSAAERLAIPLVILCQARAADVEPIARRHPDLVLVIDHLALRNIRPQVAAGQPADAFDTFDDLLALSDHENVYAKFSSLPYYSTGSYPYPDLDPYLRRAYEAFGPRRIMWASDITRMSLLPNPPTYDQCLDHVVGLDFIPGDDLPWVLGRTAGEVFNWSVD